MRPARYRIERLSVEGFRGFAAPQTLNVGGKGLFIFGPNGCGKSSIVEAIRWCLFGSPPGREIEVRNTFYPKGECRVVLVLGGPDGQLEIRRELRPGATRSRLTIRNASGAEVAERDVLPQLARIGHQEGTQVIFAAQQAVGRQAQVDVTDFTRVLCFYLNLDTVPDLLDRMGQLIEERRGEADTMAGEVEEVEKACREDLREVEAKLTELLGNPPWGEGIAPTGGETAGKVQAFVDEQATVHGKEPLSLPSAEALEIVRQWVDEAANEAVESLERRIGSLKEKLGAAQDEFAQFTEADEGARKAREDANEEREELSGVLAGETIEGLRKQLAGLEAAMTERDARRDLARRAQAMLTGHPSGECPLCGSDQTPEALLEKIRTRVKGDGDTGADAERAEQIRKRIAMATEKEQALRKLEEEEDSCQRKRDAAGARLAALFEVEVVDQAGVERRLEVLKAEIASLTGQIENKDAEKRRRLRTIRDLEEELRYHAYRDRSERLKLRLQSGLEGARGLLTEYREVLHTLETLKRAVSDAFNEALDRATPPLDRMMTEVYGRLTRQASYDQVRVVRSDADPTRRELRVASSRIPDQTFAVNVLNGQAAKALQLVPYFVFSRFQPQVMELDLLLIDDPSESFDTSHVESLVKELATAARHAQLVIATHESERFEPHLRTTFPAESWAAVYVNEGFDPLEGPKLAV